ncbi:Uncharacterised protein [Mycobacteroides abscessus subsp. abscessus]|nr:Uncharacterised protein [Mycobacteroides abscessus subsp. abscessus]
MSTPCYDFFVFDDLTTDDLAAYRAQIVEDSFKSARHIASTFLANGPGNGLTPQVITDTLLRHDLNDPHYERLAPFEKRWTVLVVRILDTVADPTLAVRYAHSRGASWSDIGKALGLSRQTAHKRFKLAAHLH